MKLAETLALAALSDSRHKVVEGLRVYIEYPKGSMRELKNDEGTVVWKKRMFSHYGYIKQTTGCDGDEVDVMLGPLTKFSEVYIVRMIDKGPDVDQREDEDKVMLGYPSADAARQAFHLQYPKNFFGAMTVLTLGDFKKKLAEAQLPHREKKLHAAKQPCCPKCGSKKYSLQPTDFETRKCDDCGKNF